MILVFGGNGQLGQELAGAAATRDIPLKALARSAADITDPGAIERAFDDVRPSVVVNAAAYTKVDLSEKEVMEAERGNILGPGIVAEACAASGIPLVHMSTDYVFDGQKAEPYVEDDPIAPLGVYGRTKAEGEERVRGALPHHVILRTAWVYGEFGHNFLKTMVRLAQERDELRVVADQRGSPTSTRDLASAILRIAPRLAAGDAVWGTYHFAGSGVTTWHGFAERIVAAQAPLTGRRPRVIPIMTADYPTPARRPANSTFACDRFACVFGFRGRPWSEQTDEIATAVVNAQQRTRLHHGA
ncbi:MAG: dTDP-4-dehydrorhamnose reductase [Rhizobiales bacterium]|nr:dTDP-4-dehydrorhamnose reductase [Hyphomicrobiales bacterium]